MEGGEASSAWLPLSGARGRANEEEDEEESGAVKAPSKPSSIMDPGPSSVVGTGSGGMSGRGSPSGRSHGPSVRCLMRSESMAEESMSPGGKAPREWVGRRLIPPKRGDQPLKSMMFRRGSSSSIGEAPGASPPRARCTGFRCRFSGSCGNIRKSRNRIEIRTLRWKKNRREE